MAIRKKVQTTLPTVAANDVVPVFQSLAVAEFDGEPRVRDLDLAERLGFERPRKIRELIERNKAEIEAMGVCPAVGQTHGPQGGRPTKEFYLNEEQALLVATLSNTSQAQAVRAALIRTFVAYRRGHLEQPAGLTDTESRKIIGGIVKAVITNQLQTILPQLVQAEIVSSQYTAVRGLTAGEVLDMAGFTNRKGLRGLAGWASSQLRRFHAAKETASPLATLGRSTAYVFDRGLYRALPGHELRPADRPHRGQAVGGGPTDPDPSRRMGRA